MSKSVFLIGRVIIIYRQKKVWARATIEAGPHLVETAERTITAAEVSEMTVEAGAEIATGGTETVDAEEKKMSTSDSTRRQKTMN